MERQVIIFDYDGTLHETMRIYKPAIAEVVRWLREELHEAVEQPGDERISSWLGMNTADMWQDFMPELPQDLRMKAGMRVGDYMAANMKAGLARWYDGTEEMLTELCGAGYELAVLSNCGNSYARAHWDQFGMERWFSAFFACETWNGIPKHEILCDIAADYEGALDKSPVKRISAQSLQDGAGKDRAEMPVRICAVVGDRDSDLAAAKAAGVPFIGCLYGYGSRQELEGSSVFVTKTAEIVSAAEACVR